MGTLGGVVEVGTLGGYSTIWMARGLPEGGKLVTFEVDEKTARVGAELFRDCGSARLTFIVGAQVAKDNTAHAGLADGVGVVVGPAEKSLAAMAGAEEGRPDDAVRTPRSCTISCSADL